MEKDGAALLLLLFVLVLAMLGVVLFVTGSSRRAALAERGRGGNDDARGQAPAPVLRRLAAPAPEPAAGSATGCRAPARRSRPPTCCCCASRGRCSSTVVLSLFMPRGVAFAVRRRRPSLGVARVLVERKRGQRRDEFINQLPDVARVLSNGTSAGLSMAGAMELAARELAQPAATEMEVVVQETRLGMPLEASLERLRDRLPSREVAVLMTTLIIQQRAGGDTVRALSELGQTLEARKDLLREIRTMLSGAVFTSYLVAVMGAGTLVLVEPDLARDHARADDDAARHRSRCSLAAIALRRGVRDHPAASRRWRHDAAAARRALGRRVASPSALLAIPLLRDRGPIDRLEQRPRRATATPTGGAAAPAVRVAGRAARARASRPRMRASKRESIDRRLDLAGRPAALTVQRFVGYKAARR